MVNEIELQLSAVEVQNTVEIEELYHASLQDLYGITKSAPITIKPTDSQACSKEDPGLFGIRRAGAFVTSLWNSTNVSNKKQKIPIRRENGILVIGTNRIGDDSPLAKNVENVASLD